MAYRDNVQRIADDRHIHNPLREEDLGIAGLIFEEPGKHKLLIQGSDKNRGSRLFFEHVVESAFGIRVTEFSYTNDFKDRVARPYFAQLWNDMVPSNRKLLLALKASSKVTIMWKEDYPKGVPETIPAESP